MFYFAAILKANPVGVFATTNENKVQTRLFQFLFAEGKKVYFCTSSEKPVYAQLKANPYASFCTYSQNFAPVVSVNGKAVFDDGIALKKRALDENPQIKGIYNTPDNPVFKLFYIDVEEVQTFSFDEGPKSYKLSHDEITTV
jgi:uncharacterized pyridoxamine 5'-phosphate oxidase family protein